MLGWALAFSAGTFLCISLGDLLPEVHFHSHDRLWLSVQLIDVSSGQPLWGGTYERQVEDLFSLQRELALDISAKIRPHLAPEPA